MVKYCKECRKDNRPPRHPGYFFWFDDNDYECSYDKNKLIDCNITKEELFIMSDISSDSSFIQAMDELKEKDIIEFNLKMSQFKDQVNKQKVVEENSVPKCPHCNSTNIKSLSGLNRGASIAMFGIFSKKINKSFECKNCGYTW